MEERARMDIDNARLPTELRRSDFFYELPEEQIAQHPCARRDGSRLFVLDRKSGKNEHRIFSDIVSYLRPEDILVVYDDISLAPGQLRIRAKGSAGGHNGIKSIIAHLGTQEFPRVKVGIGEKPPRMDLADYVLGHFSSGEKKIMEEAAKEAADAICEIVNVGIEQAMNDHNRRKEEQK